MACPPSHDAGDVQRGEMHAPDAELLSAFLRGEEHMFSELVRRHERPLYGFICRLTGRPSDAADLFQETFVRVFEKADSFTGKSSFKTWLYSIATNVCRSHGRRARRNRHVAREEAPASLDASRDPAATAASRDVGSKISRAVAELPQEQREVFAMRVYDEMSYREIAEAVGRPVGTVKSQMRRALRKMRVLLRSLADAYDLT